MQKHLGYIKCIKSDWWCKQSADTSKNSQDRTKDLRMSKNCLKCKLEVSEDKTSFNCDGCNRPLHIQCANVTATEAKCLQRQARKLKFFCEDCEEGLLQVPVLRKLIEDLQLEVEKLKNKNSDCILENENIVNEVFERQKRSKNLIIYNLPEPNASEPAQRKEEDKKKTIEILKDLSDSPVEIKNIYRLGKKNDRIRPVKVMLDHAENVINILKKKRNLKNITVRIASDQTPVKAELEERKLRGEQDIFIRYVKGVPQIIKEN